jgi:hypothetical protein
MTTIKNTGVNDKRNRKGKRALVANVEKLPLPQQQKHPQEFSKTSV